MKILVTGGAGFIGFHLIQALLDRGDKVVNIDNLNTYYNKKLKYDRLAEIAKHTKAAQHQFIELDLADRTAVASLFEQHRFDMVVNLAAQAGVRYSIDNPHAYVDSNLVGFVNILEGCRYSQVKHLVYASSSSVYGMNTKHPFSTFDRVDHPISLYAATKKANELMAHTYSHLYGFPTTGLRFFTVYGPMGRPDMAYFSFTQKILNDESINVFNNGDMKRDFTYIDDIVEGIVRVLYRQPSISNGVKTTNTQAPFKIYNIGNNQPITLRHFITAIETATGKKAKENLLPMQPGDVPITYADVDDLIADIGFKPATSIEEGITKFVKWYREYYSK
jgi:UDP-glucuronate 4-epimerase